MRLRIFLVVSSVAIAVPEPGAASSQTSPAAPKRIGSGIKYVWPVALSLGSVEELWDSARSWSDCLLLTTRAENERLQRKLELLKQGIRADPPAAPSPAVCAEGMLAKLTEGTAVQLLSKTAQCGSFADVKVVSGKYQGTGGCIAQAALVDRYPDPAREQKREQERFERQENEMLDDYLLRLRSPQTLDRVTGALALAAMEGSPRLVKAVPALVELLVGDETEDVRLAVIEALAKAGAHASQALDSLRQVAASDKRPAVVQAAEKAIARISQ